MLKVLKCSQCIIIPSVRNFVKKPLPPIDMKYLNVAEKNEAAKTIAGLLSKGAANRREGYSVYNKIYDFDGTVNGRHAKMVMTSVSGHLLQLEFLPSYRNWRNVDPQSLFDAPVRKTCKEDYQPIKRTLEREIRGCNGLIIWTDCDREGENIGMEIIDVCRAIKPNLVIYRAVFSEITAAAVSRALQQLKSIDKRSSDAVNVRTELDLRTGAAITRFQTLRLQRLFPQNVADKLISYGSCQIPTLGFVAERYKEIEAFVSEPFWKIKVLHTKDDLSVEFNWARHRLFNQEECENYYLICIADPKATVESVTVKPKNKWRPMPMDTVEMEKLASRKLKLAAKDTMTIAEKLYTKGFISYPRTETNQFSKEFDLRSLVEHQTSHPTWGEFAQRILESGPNPRNGNKSDQAHPPIHPTKLITNLEGNEARVYELICRHFLACVSKDAVGMETIVHINIAGEKFTANGLCIHERNYLDVYIYDKWNAKQIHKYEQGQEFEPTDISMPEGATTAPPMLTEADLIALMEKHGIGTDATHAEHINTIKERGYIGVIDKGFLIPGVIGMALYEGYNAIELELAKPVLRASFEVDLKKICLGEKDPQEVLHEQITKYKEAYKHIMDHVTAMDTKISQRFNETITANAEVGNGNVENNSIRLQEIFKCPKCNVANLALKHKKNQSGYYIGCLNFPDCKNAIWLPDECKEPQVLDETCSKCGNNTIKLLKLKFDSAFYKTEFNAPYGWYKTCLLCDSHFRNVFNINLDCVKRTGAIIDQGSRNHTANTLNNNNNENTSTLGNIGRNASTNYRNNNNSNVRANKKSNSTSTNNLPVPKKPKTTTTKTTTKKKSSSATTGTTLGNFASTSNNIRNFFHASENRSTEVTNNESVQIASEAVVNNFFDTNDSFDDQNFLMVEANINAGSISHTANGRGGSSTNTVINEVDLENVFANDYFDNAADEIGDEDFANISWGTGNLSSSGNSNNQRNNYSNNNNNNVDIDASWGSNGTQKLATAKISTSSNAIENNSNWPNRTQNPNELIDHNVKCSGCHTIAKRLTVRKEGPNKGRPFYSCSKSNPCKFFQWADEEQPTTSSNSRNITKTSSTTTATPSSNLNNISTEQQKCNCGREAKCLIVRKEGPNKGRQFYACSNQEKSCGYFQWANDNQSASSSSRMTENESWGTSSNSRKTTSTSTSTAGSRESRKRKCGLCRQEGHTRSKCPQSAQFQL